MNGVKVKYKENFFYDEITLTCRGKEKKICVYTNIFQRFLGWFVGGSKRIRTSYDLGAKKEYIWLKNTDLNSYFNFEKISNFIKDVAQDEMR